MNLEDIYILNPDYNFKPDLDRVCMYSVVEREYDSSNDWNSYIHPYQATILLMFDGLRSVGSIVEAISTHFKISEETAIDLIKDYIENPEPIQTEWQGERIPFPKNVLINIDKIKGEIKERKEPDFTDLRWDAINVKNDRSHLAPHKILWMMTNRCVTDCAYCYADKHTMHTPLSTEAGLQIIEDAYRLGVLNIDVIGGEVFLHKDWDILIGRMVERGMSPTFLSTKVPVSESIVAKLKKTGYKNVVQISLDSLDADVVNHTIRVGGNYLQQVIEGIKRLDEAGFKIQIDTILTKDTATEHNLERLAELFKTINNFEYWEIRVPELSLYSTKRFQEVMASRQQLEDIRKYVKDTLVESFGRRIIFSANVLDQKFHHISPKEPCFDGGLCGYLSRLMFILPYGKVSSCEQLYWHPEFIVGDLTKNTIEEIWRSPRVNEIIHRTEKDFREESKCKSCSFFESCSASNRRCAVKVLKAYGYDNWDYPDPRCTLAPELKFPLSY